MDLTKPELRLHRYTGMERDDETGLSYHNARYYIPWLGRWLNPDPIGIGDGVNVYAYCGNNPVLKIDSTGMGGDDPPLRAATGGSAGSIPVSTQAGQHPATQDKINNANAAEKQRDALKSAVGPATGKTVSQAGILQHKRETAAIESDKATGKAFKDLKLVKEKVVIADPNAAAEAGKAKIASAVLFGLSLLFGPGGLLLDAAIGAYSADLAITGAYQASSNRELPTLFEAGASYGAQRFLNLDKESADIAAKYLHTGVGLGLGFASGFKGGANAVVTEGSAAEGGVHSFGSLKNMSGSLDDAAALARNQPYGPNTNIFRRLPNSAQDVQALTEAQAGMGRNLNIKLGDPTYQGWEKWHHSVGPKGSKSVVHYLRNPQTGFLTDFKFK